MLKKVCFLSIVLFTLTLTSAFKANAQEVTIDYFYDQLSPYGHWENTNDYGYVWIPYGTQPGWRPYSDGYWVYTDNGWTYQADTDWAWAVYHYGRWAYLDYYGWAWVPGTEWAPAWVAWRNDDNYIGWAPLPPQVEWRAGIGLRTANFDIDVDIPWSNWCFVDYGHFDDPRVRVYVQSSARNVTFLRRTHNITRYEFSNQRIVNHSFDADRFEHFAHRPVVRYNVVEAPNYRKVGVNRGGGHAEIRVFRPQIQSKAPQSMPREMENRHDLSSTRKYDKERSKYDKHYDKEYSKLMETQRREEAETQKKEETQRQHEAEVNAYREQRSRETKALENRHVNDMEKAHKNNGNGNNGNGKGNGNGNKNNNQGKGHNSDNQQQNQKKSDRK